MCSSVKSAEVVPLLIHFPAIKHFMETFCPVPGLSTENRIIINYRRNSRL